MYFIHGNKYAAPEEIAVSIETTGLDSGSDELLRIVIINALCGDVVFDSLVKPSEHAEWTEAEEVNHISPDMVCSSPVMCDILPEVATILVNSKKIICYNEDFCLSFLENSGCIIPRNAIIYDVMKFFALIKGDYNEYFGSYTYRKLSECAENFGVDYDRYDTLSKCRAVLNCFSKIKCVTVTHEWEEDELYERN